MIFYNLAEFAFEHLRDSRRILAPLEKSFFLKLFFATWSYRYLDLARALATVLLPLCLFFVLFFWHNKLVGGFFVLPKSHNLRRETKCLKLSPEGFCEIPPQKQSWGRQPPMKDKGKNWTRPGKNFCVVRLLCEWSGTTWTFISHMHNARSNSFLSFSNFLVWTGETSWKIIQ